MSADPAITLAQVNYFFGRGSLRKQILFDIDLSVNPGEIIILTGPSGSGKTTLLSLMGALRSPKEGSIRLFGQELARSSEKLRSRVRKEIGFIYQQHNLLESLSVAQNVQLALELAPQRKRKEWPEIISQVLGQVGMADHIDKLPAQLSGGQKQRVGIARALANSPRIILADEPTASLDKQSGRDVVELVRRLAREAGAAVILVTHDNRILDIADRILNLEDGRLKGLVDAVGDDTSRLLNVLSRHNPDAGSYLATIAMALTRVATADQVVTPEESEVIRGILREVSQLSPGEIELVMELSRVQVGAGPVDDQRVQSFRDALYAVAAADGSVSAEEEQEILAILRETGLEQDK